MSDACSRCGTSIDHWSWMYAVIWNRPQCSGRRELLTDTSCTVFYCAKSSRMQAKVLLQCRIGAPMHRIFYQLLLAVLSLRLTFQDPTAELRPSAQLVPTLPRKKNYLLRLYLRSLLGTAICEELGMPKFSSQTRNQQYLCWVYCRMQRMHCKSLTWRIVFATAHSFVQSAVATLHWDPLWNSLHDLEACNMTTLQYLYDFCHANCWQQACRIVFFLH